MKISILCENGKQTMTGQCHQHSIFLCLKHQAAELGLFLLGHLQTNEIEIRLWSWDFSLGGLWGSVFLVAV